MLFLLYDRDRIKIEDIGRSRRADVTNFGRDQRRPRTSGQIADGGPGVGPAEIEQVDLPVRRSGSGAKLRRHRDRDVSREGRRRRRVNLVLVDWTNSAGKKRWR